MHPPAFDEFKNPKLREEHKQLCARIKNLIEELRYDMVTNRRLGALKVIQLTVEDLYRDQMYVAKNISEPTAHLEDPKTNVVK